MNRTLHLTHTIALILVSSLLFFSSCKQEPPTDLTKAIVIPKPVSVEATGKSFKISDETVISVRAGNAELSEIGNYLSSRLNKVTGITVKAQTAEESDDNSIVLSIGEADQQLGEEGYDLSITEDGIVLKGNTAAGVFHGVQTLLQILPVSLPEGETKWKFPTGTVRDYPSYAWRGTMLDVARHFFGVEDVKRYIDLISYYKMNVLHLHLTDDQGWRIEIKSWPNLATHGGSTQVGGAKGGYYTQEQYKDIVAYAASRYIMIVPEVDLPGHINSALASYAELNGGTIVPAEGRYVATNTQGVLDGKNKPTELYTGTEVGWSTLRREKPSTFKFVDDVMRELAAITPGPYLHIGGDEAHVTRKDDYKYFIERFQQIVQSHGKKMIGWGEIAQANIDSSVTAQNWNSAEMALMAAQKGASIIMSPATLTYLDMQYDSTTRIGLHWAAYIEVDKAYSWSPDTLVAGIERDQIRGVEAPLWSETVVTMDDIEFLAFPRLPGIAEVAWTPTNLRSWEEYKVRLGNHGPQMKAWGIDFYESKLVPWKK